MAGRRSRPDKGRLGTGDLKAAKSPANKLDPKDSLIEPTWYASAAGGPPLTELIAENQGALSPFGDDTDFPLPVSALAYEHPTDKPNRAENN